jgi:hypothetical protein
MDGEGRRAYRAAVGECEGNKLCIWKTLRTRNGVINMDLKENGWEGVD